MQQQRSDGLCETSSWRLLVGGLAPAASHHSCTTSSEEPPLSNFNSQWDIPPAELLGFFRTKKDRDSGNILWPTETSRRQVPFHVFLDPGRVLLLRNVPRAPLAHNRAGRHSADHDAVGSEDAAETPRIRVERRLRGAVGRWTKVLAARNRGDVHNSAPSPASSSPG